MRNRSAMKDKRCSQCGRSILEDLESFTQGFVGLFGIKCRSCRANNRRITLRERVRKARDNYGG